MPEVNEVATEKTTIAAGDQYQTAKSASGSVSKHSGDVVATQLVGLTLDETYAIAAEALDTTVDELVAKYEHLNDGMQRMNLGNRIRGAVNKINRNNEKAKAKNEEGGMSGEDYLITIAEPARIAADERAEAAQKAIEAADAERKQKALEKAEAAEAKKAAKEAAAAEKAEADEEAAE